MKKLIGVICAIMLAVIVFLFISYSTTNDPLYISLSPSPSVSPGNMDYLFDQGNGCVRVCLVQPYPAPDLFQGCITMSGPPPPFESCGTTCRGFLINGDNIPAVPYRTPCFSAECTCGPFT